MARMALMARILDKAYRMQGQFLAGIVSEFEFRHGVTWPVYCRVGKVVDLDLRRKVCRRLHSGS